MNKRMMTMVLLAAMVMPCMSGCKKQASEPAKSEPASEAAQTETEAKAEEAASGTTTLNIGDVITFGTYEQDMDMNNGPEAIEWEVCAIDETEHKAYLISKYVLEVQPFHSEFADVTWETCSLRTWLNDTFYNQAFTPEEQAKILTTSLTPDENPQEYDVDYGNPTEDKVFILSYAEAKEAEPIRHHLNGTPTPYAVAMGGFKQDMQTYGNPYEFNCWLRTTGAANSAAMYSYSNTNVLFNGQNVNKTDGAVNPAMWISLD